MSGNTYLVHAKRLESWYYLILTDYNVSVDECIINFNGSLEEITKNFIGIFCYGNHWRKNCKFLVTRFLNPNLWKLDQKAFFWTSPSRKTPRNKTWQKSIFQGFQFFIRSNKSLESKNCLDRQWLLLAYYFPC